MVRLRFETDLANSLKAVQDLSTAIGRIPKNFNAAAKEAEKLERAAKKITDSNLTPQERYNVKLDQMAKAVKAGRLSMEDATRTAERMRAKLDETAKVSGNVFGAGAISNLKSYMTGIVSISGAVALFRSEMEALKAEAEKVAQTQLGAAGARDVLKRNIAPGGVVAGRAIEARADALAGELGLPQRFIDLALAEAVSSSPDTDTAFNRTRVAAQFLKTRPEGIGEFTGALGDVAKSTGDKDDLRNLGFLISVGAQSRVSDDRKLAESLPKALAGTTAYGATPEEGGALFDALTRAAADTEGRISGTGAIRTAEQLQEFFDKRIAEKKSSADIDTFGERLQALRADPAAAKEFVDKASFESKVKGPLRQFLLDPTSDISKEYERFKTGFGTREHQIELAKENVAYLDEGRVANTAAIERTIAAKAEQFRLSTDAELTQQSREEIIQRTKKITGQWDWPQRAAVFSRTGPTMTPSEAISELETAFKVEGNTRDMFSGQLDPELVKNTRAMIDELKALRDQQKTLSAPKPSGRQEK